MNISKRNKIYFSVFLFLFGWNLLFSQTSMDVSSEKIRVGFYADRIFNVGQTDDERKSGYGYDYYQEIAKYTGWEYEYVYGSWNDVYKKFLNGDVDILGGVTKNPELEKKMFFSEYRMGTDDFYIFVTEDNTDIHEFDITTLNGKKIGVNEEGDNITFLKRFLNEKKIDAKIVICNGYSQRIGYLLNGEIDAMVSSDILMAQGVRSIYRISTENFYFAVRPGRPDILEELNHAQRRLLSRNPDYDITLRNKYFKNAVTRIKLNVEERGWLENHPVLKVGYRVNVMPFCDQDKKTGELTGLLYEVLNYFRKNLGMDFEVTPYKSNELMANELRDGNIDLCFPVVDDPWYSEKQGYIQTSKIVENRMALIYAGNYKGESGYTKIGYVPGSPAQEIFLNLYGIKDKAYPCPTMFELFKAIKKGDVDCTIMNADVANVYMHKDEQFLKLQTANLEQFVGFSFGVSKKNTALYSVMELGISQLNPGAINESVNRFSHRDEKLTLLGFWKKYRSVFMTMIIWLLIVVIVVILIYSHYLAKAKRKAIDEREKALNADRVAHTDELTGAQNRRSVFEVLDRVNSQGLPYVVAFLDVDDFKNYNNNYGHETGDLVLKFMVDSLHTAFPDAFVGRFGGDEFVVISERIPEEVKKQFEKFLVIVNEGFMVSDTGLHISVGSSIGINPVQKRVIDIRDVIGQADAAMYKAKKQGKNRIVI